MRTLALGTHPRLRYLITITRRDETVIRLTTDQRAIVLPDGTTWNTCPGLQIGDFTERNDGTLPSTSLSAFMEEDGAFDPYDVDNNLFEDALVEVDFIDRGAAASPDHRYFWFRGYLNGGTQYGLGREVQFDVLNAFATPRDIFVRQYNIPCDADFGDPLRCKIPTWPYSYTGNTDLHDVTTLEVIAVGDRRRHRFGSDNTRRIIITSIWNARPSRPALRPVLPPPMTIRWGTQRRTAALLGQRATPMCAMCALPR
jgi:hypothetical protein